MARPRRFTDEEILATTQSCILEHGPGVSTLMIADQIGLSQAALFKRFGTKEQLIVRSLQQPMQPNPIAHLLQKGPTDAPIPDQLVEIGTTTMVILRRVIPCLTMLHAAGVNPNEDIPLDDRPAIQARRLLTAWFAEALAHGRIQSANPHVLAVGFLGMLHARPFREIIMGDTELNCTDVEYIQDLVDTMWRGIAPEETQ